MILFTKHQFKNYIAVAIFPIIIINKNYKGNLVLVNHEKIHLKQQIELLWIGFFVWYLIEFLYRYYQYKNWYMAYKNISFEQEADRYEMDLEYLKNRKRFSFYSFL